MSTFRKTLKWFLGTPGSVARPPLPWNLKPRAELYLRAGKVTARLVDQKLMAKVWLFGSGVLAFAALIAPAARSQEGGKCRQIVGFVTDRKTYHGIAAASVSVVGDLASHAVVTDGSGEFLLEFKHPIECGQTVRLRITKTGYAPFDKFMSVPDALPLPITLDSNTPGKASAQEKTKSSTKSISGPVEWVASGNNGGYLHDQDDAGKRTINEHVFWTVEGFYPSRDVAPPMTLRVEFNTEIIGEPVIKTSSLGAVTMKIVKHSGNTIIVEIVDPPIHSGQGEGIFMWGYCYVRDTNKRSELRGLSRSQIAP